jgi:CheY-like chemotaxis protein
MSGIEAARRLASWPDTRNIPIIALSAAAPIRSATPVNQTGFCRSLTKPVNVDALLAVIDELLARENPRINSKGNDDD